jgi:hypothetical protein
MELIAMFNVHAYLRTEIKRYFPNATKVDVMDVDETWDVFVHLPDVAEPLHYHMDVGSDDGCFAFTNPDTDATITVPFAPEMEG